MNKEKILNFKFEEFIIYLKNISYEERLNLLNDQEILFKIFLLDSNQSVWDFEKIASLYKPIDLLLKFTSKIIDKITIIHPYYEYVYLVILKRQNQLEFEKSLKENTALLNLLLIKGEDFYSELSFSCDTILYIIKYVEQNNIDYNKTCLYSMITSSIKTIEDQEKYINSDIDIFYKKKVFDLFNTNIINKFIKNNIVNLSKKEIYNILVFSEVELDPNLYYNEEFFEYKILSPSFYEMRKTLDLLANHIDIEYYNNLLAKMEDRLINNYQNNNNFILDNSPSIDRNYIELEHMSNTNDFKILLKLIIDKLFQDNVRNVYLNINEILEYNNDLSKEKIIFYHELISLINKDIYNLLEFYNKYKDSYEISNYYDDVRKTKNKSYELIKEKCLRIKDINNLQNVDLSNKYDVPIYELNGEKFYMLVTCRSRIPQGNNNVPRNCYSLIGYNNMKVFNENNYIYGFDNFDINKIMHVYEEDAYSLIGEKNTTRFINRIRTPDEILLSNKMSEIQIKNERINDKEYERLLPSYVVCFDELNDKSIEAAKCLNIPIVIIHKEKYKQLEESKYLSNYDEEYTTSMMYETEYNNKKKN